MDIILLQSIRCCLQWIQSVFKQEDCILEDEVNDLMKEVDQILKDKNDGA